ncbi:MAG TPA: response regulator [Terriglobales bacterium]|nr:response regulator [Terriglobales bacterium]
MKTRVPHSFKYRILIVDDCESLLAAAAALLSREGYVVETAHDGFEALMLLRGSQPEILISDLKLPNMSGFELLAVVRKRFPAMGVIAMSGEFSAAGMPEGILADRFVTKGENCAFELVEIVRELMSVSPVRAQPSKPEIAPAWLPRSQRGYVVVTCPGCLRSFSVLQNQAEPGFVHKDTCIHCGIEVAYCIDATTVHDPRSSSENSAALVAASKKMIAHSSEKIGRSKHRSRNESARKTE